MVAYSIEKAKREAIKHCRNPIPATSISITRHLKKKVSSFYPNSPAKKITPRIKKNILKPLEEEGFLVKYTTTSPAWSKARALVSRYKKVGEPLPRGITELYQTHFLYLEESYFPTIKNLPKPNEELNLDLVVMLSKFEKTRTYTWDMLNLLLCSSKENTSNQLRLYLYKLPLDYNQVEILEKILEYGTEYSYITFPFKPDIENAKIFLRKITRTKR